MICKNCGREFEGNFCPNCGMSASGDNINAPVNTNKKVKKPFYKKWWVWVIAAILLIIIIGGTSSNSNEKPEIVDKSESQTNVEAVDNTEQTNQITKKITNNSLENILTEDKKVIVKDVCEFFLDYKKITADVMPPKPASWYTHYEAEQGKMYVDICIGYKNLSDRAIEADEVGMLNLMYAEKYPYYGFSVIEEDNRGDFTYSNITSIDPLTTEYLHYLVEIPKEAADSTESLVATLYIDNNLYTIKVR